MDEKEFKNIFEELNPTTSQTEKIWRNVSEKITAEGHKNKKKLTGSIKYVAATAIAMVVLLVSGVGINAATDGEFVSKIQKVMGGSKSSQEILEQAEKVESNGIETYASDIMYLDDELLVFGNLRGIVLYDLEKEKVFGTIDIQKIDCIYFGGDSKRTCVVKDGNAFILFNEENGRPYGSYYKYEIAKGSEMALSPSEVGDDEESLKHYDQLWKAEGEKEIDTFDKFCNRDEVKYLFSNDSKYDTYDTIMYSEKSKCWTDAAGEEKVSFITIIDNSYILYTYQRSTKEFSTIKIQMDRYQTGQEGAGETSHKVQSLPEFVYTGTDMAVKAICNYWLEEKREYLEDGEVWIPNFIIYKEVKAGDEYLVFGNFWSESYRQIGNILESEGGGEMPACFHLLQTEDGYEVVGVDRAGDGADYVKDIKAFTKGYKGLYEQFMDWENREIAREEERKKSIQMYVRNNNLDLKYYKDYGRDPVEIFDE